MACVRINKQKYENAKKAIVEKILQNDQEVIDILTDQSKTFASNRRLRIQEGINVGVLSLQEKLIVIEEAAQKASSITEKERILALKDKVKDSIVLEKQSVVSDKKWIDQQLDILPAEKSTFLQMHMSKPSRLIPLLSAELNSKIFKQLRSTFYAKSFWDLNTKTLVSSNSELQISLSKYQKDLINVLYDWVVSNGFEVPSFVPFSTNMKNGLASYKAIMNAAWDLIKQKVERNGGSIFNVYSSEENIKNTIDPITAFYVLQNFDDCVEYFSGGAIEVNQHFKGTLNSIEDKYVLARQKNRPGSYEDVYADIDGDKITSKLLAQFLQTIKLPSGEYLSTKSLSKLVYAVNYLMEQEPAYIKSVMDTGGSLEPGYQTWHDILYGTADLDSRLGGFIIKLQSDLNLHRQVSKQECEALASALLDYLEAVDKKFAPSSDAFDSIKDAAEFADAYHIGQQFLANFSKSVMTYQSINKDGKTEYKSALEYSRTKTGIAHGIEIALTDQLTKGQLFRFRDGFQVNSNQSWDSFSDIYSPRMQRLFQDFTGISLSPKSLQERLSTDKGIRSVGKFLRDYRRIILKYFGDRKIVSKQEVDSALPNIMFELKRLGSYIEFTDIIMDNDSSDNIKLLDQNGNTVPTEGTHTTIAKHRHNIEEFASSWQNPRNCENILVTMPGLTSITVGFDTDAEHRQVKDSKCGFITHIVMALDAAVAKKDANSKFTKYLKTTDLSVGELAAIGLSTDYLQSIVEDSTMLTQIDAYSDKVRIAKGAWNLLNIPLHSYALGGFTGKKSGTLKYMLFHQHSSYYLETENQICKIMSGVFETQLNSIDDVAKMLESLESEQDLKNKVLKYQKNHPEDHTSILRDVHYSVYGNRLGINATLYAKIKEAHDSKLYARSYERGLESFINDIQKFGADLLYDVSKIAQLPDHSQENFLYLFGYTHEQILQFRQNQNSIDKGEAKSTNLVGFDQVLQEAIECLQSNNFAFESLEGVQARSKEAKNIKRRNELKRIFLERYFALTTLTREADLQVSLKHAWNHDKVSKIIDGDASEAKDAGLNTLATFLQEGNQIDSDVLNATFERLGTNFETDLDREIEQAILLELNTRLVKSKKRYNAAPASFQPWETGTKYGLPKRMKITHFEHARQAVYNYFGNTDTMNSHDGAIFSTGVTRRFESHSASGRHVASSLKTIMLQPYFAGFTQIKCADYEMNNAFIRWSIRNRDYSHENFDGIEIMYKMLSPSKITDEFCENFANNQKDLGYNFYFDFKGRRAKLVSINNSGHNFTFQWQYVDGDKELVDAETVHKSMHSQASLNADGSIKLNTLFDLWEAFGGAYCISQESDGENAGEIGYSDASQYILADLMSEFDTTEQMKSEMIHKLIDEEASKSSQAIKNTKASLESRSASNDFVVSWIDPSRYGIQQDYSHHSDESKIPGLTQVITAVAFNGENTQMVQNMYEVLGHVVRKSLDPIVKKWGASADRTEFHQYMAKQLLKSLQTNSVASNAEDIVRDLYNAILQWNAHVKGAEKITTIPYSDSQLFYKASSDLMAELNSTAIRQEFSGIAVVQNPANGIVGVYEDVNGVVYTKTAVIKLANEWAAKQPGNIAKVNRFGIPIGTEIAYKPEEILEAYLHSAEGKLKFKNEVITTNSFNKLGIGSVIQYIGPDLQYISSYKKGVPVTSNIKSNQTYIISDPAMLKALYDGVKAGATVTKMRTQARDLGVTQITWESVGDNDPGNLWLLDSTQELVNAGKKGKITDKTLQQWHSANLRGLKDSTPFYYATRQDFIAGIKTILVKSTPDGQQQPIKIVYKGGEEILPKKFKTALSLGNHTMDEIKNNPNFFVDLARRKFTLDLGIGYTNKFGSNAIGIAMNNSDIILTSKSLKESESLGAPINAEFVQYGTDIDGITPKWGIQDENGNRISGIEIISMEKPDMEVSITKPHPEGKVQIVLYTQGVDKIASNFNWFYEAVKKDANAFYGPESVMRFNKVVRGAKTDSIESIIEGAIANMAQKLRTSFEATTRTVSARIPSQAFQSFLANETVGYTETDANDGYMNIWEMWFQGSDYDIDKAYTLMYELDSNGCISGNIFTDHSSLEAVQASLLLPAPSGNGIAINTAKKQSKYSGDVDINSLIGDLQVATNIEFSDFYQLSDILDQMDPVERLKKIATILEFLKPYKSLYYTTDLNRAPQLIYNLSDYNLWHESLAASKNRIMQCIYTAASDLNNLRAAEVPMEMKSVTQVIDKMDRRGKKVYNDMNMFTIWQVQRENAVGKKDVGIAANAIKADGSLQQYYNNLFAKQDIDTDALDLKLEFNQRQLDAEGNVIGFRKISTDRIFRLANTKIDKDTYFRLLDKTFKTGLKEHPLYGLYLSYLANPSDFEIGAPAYKALSNKESNFIQGLKSAIDRNIYNSSRSVDDNFKEVLYYGTSLEPNVADTLSVFISMATDNAKELALSRMNGRPELLSLPLAMITIGMDIEDVIDVCVNLLDVISNDLDQSRYSNRVSSDIRKLILKHASGPSAARGSDRQFDEATTESLLKIYDIAQELRTITGFFSVNQGVKTKYTELQIFLKGLSDSKIKNAENKKSALIAAGYDEKEAKKPFDFKKMFSGDEDDDVLTDYQKQIIAEYGLTKTAFNVMRVVLQTPHFKAQLKSITQMTDVIESMSGKATLASKILGLTPEIDSESRSKTEEVNYANKVVRLVDSYMLERALNKMDEFQFVKDDLIDKFEDWNDAVSGDSIIGTKNLTQLENFLEFFEKGLLPYLQRKYPNNYFLQNLIRRTDYRTDRMYYDLPFDAFDARANLAVAEDINLAAGDFEEIAPLPIGVKSITGKQASIGEMFYIYAMITSVNSIRGSLTCIYKAAKKHSNITKYMENEYMHFDELAQQAAFDPTDFPRMSESEIAKRINLKNQAITELDRIKKILLPYIKALRSENGYYVEDNVKYDVTDFFIQTMSKGRLESGIRFENSGESLRASIQGNIVRVLGLDQKAKDLITVETQILSVGNNHTAVVTITHPSTFGEGANKFTIRKSFTLDVSKGVVEIPAEIVNDIVSQATQNTLTLNEIIALTANQGTLRKNYAIMSDPTVKANIKKLSDSDPVLGKLLKDFYEKPQPIVMDVNELDNTASHIEYINGVPVFIYNTWEFLRDSHNGSFGSLIDVYLQSQGPNVRSENDKLIALLNIVTPKEILSKNGLTEVTNVDEAKQLLQDSELQQLVEKSITFKAFVQKVIDQDKTEYVIHQAQISLNKYSQAMSHQNLYYVRLNNDKMKSLYPPKPGDIYERVNPETNKKEKWIDLGLNRENQHIFVRIENALDLSRKIVSLEFGLNNTEFTRVRSLRLPMDHIFNSSEFDHYSYEKSPVQEANIDELRSGDKLITRSGQQFFIKEIVYQRDAANPNEVERLLIGYSITDPAKVLVQINNPIKGDYMQHPDEADVIMSDPNQNIELDFKGWDQEQSLKDEILKQSIPGTVVQTKDGAKYILKSYLNGVVVTSQDQAIKIDQIDLITIKSFKDIKESAFDIIKFVPQIKFPKSDWNIEQIFKTYPEFTDGYIKSDTKTHVILRAVHRFQDAPDKFTNKFNFGDCTRIGYVTDDTSIKKGDFLEVESGSSLFAYKVIATSGDKLMCLWIKNNAQSEDSFEPASPSTYGMKMVNISDVVRNGKAILYRKNQLSVPGRIKFETSRGTAANPLLSTKGEVLINFLADKFNTTVDIINDSSKDFFAKVDNGKVIINMGKKPGSKYQSMNDSQYVATMAVHEFTHLMLANLRAQNPTQYYDLIKLIQNANPRILAGINVSGEVYDSEISVIEEKIVRYIESTLKGDIDESTPEMLSYHISSGFQSLFGEELETSDGTYKISEALSRNFFEITTEYSDIAMIRNQALSLKVLEDIKKVCK